jgi:prepilin-type N-terminal cleavage/methylation domain-containing protein
MLFVFLEGTLRGMNRLRARHAFTLVELLVALIMLGVAAAGLVRALTGDRRLRDLAASHTFAADRMRERLEQLAGLPCRSSASGTDPSVWGTEHWRASPSRFSWFVTDSIELRGSTAPVVLEARVPCPD